jgi:hypothetical protein
MANLSNDQQSALFKQQSLINSILSDSAAENAVNQFNATSENQANQFFANLKASVNQFNAAQLNAMQQFNADEINTLLEFNAELQDVRERFNAQNYLAVAQANAQWRQNIATINSAAANEANMAYAQNVNGLTMRALDEIWMRERDILSMAFQISENNAQRANTVLKGRQAQNKSAQDALKGQITFRDLLPQNAESPTFVVGRALSSGQKTPLRALNNLWNVVENAPEELKEGAASGLKNAILEWSMTKGGATSRSFSPRAMYDSLFSKIPNAQANVSVMDWMLSRGAITEAQSKKLKSYLTEMVRLEVMDSQGTLEDIAQGAGPMLDFYLRITGSAVGSRLQGLLPGGGGSGGLIAASAGSRAMRNIFDKVPESMKMDVMSEMMQNPELLAAMMRKVRNDKEKIRVAGVVGTILDKLGFIDPVVQAPRRAVPLSVSGEEIEEIQIEEEDNQSSVQPQTVPAQPVAPPTTQVAPAISAPIQQSAVQGPVDRSRYAALFPTDIASGMIRQQGIGSLMG